jgi:hypothetical protein
MPRSTEIAMPQDIAQMIAATPTRPPRTIPGGPRVMEGEVEVGGGPEELAAASANRVKRDLKQRMDFLRSELVACEAAYKYIEENKDACNFWETMRRAL